MFPGTIKEIKLFLEILKIEAVILLTTIVKKIMVLKLLKYKNLNKVIAIPFET